MKRLKNISGGMPLKLDDFDLIQDAYKDAFDAVCKSLLPEETYYILKGCVKTVASGTVSITEGYIYVLGEIYYVPAGSFTEDVSKILYFAPNFTTSENRTFHDTTTHDVWDLRVYNYVYATEAPEGGLPFAEVFSLSTLLTSGLLSTISGMANLTEIYNLDYAAGFSAATAYPKMRVEGNAFNGYMLLGAFNAIYTYGLLAILPYGLRPSADIVGFFWNGSVAPGILKIKKSGEIYVTGARNNGVNYVTFQFYMRFVDVVLYSLPISGGGAVPDSDASYDPATSAVYPINIQNTIFEDTVLTNVVPAGYKLKSINLRNLTDNPVVVLMGTTLGGSNLYDDTVPPHSTFNMELNMFFSVDADQTIYISSTDWNDVTIDLVLTIERVYS